MNFVQSIGARVLASLQGLGHADVRLRDRSFHIAHRRWLWNIECYFMEFWHHEVGRIGQPHAL